MSAPTQAAPVPRINVRTYLAIQPLFDTLALLMSWVTARSICAGLQIGGRAAQDDLRYLGAPLAAVILILWLAICIWLKHYTLGNLGRLRIGLSRLAEMVVIVAGLLVLGIPSLYENIPLELLRTFAVIFVPLSLTSLAAARYAASFTATRTRVALPGGGQIGIIGRGAGAIQMMELMRRGGHLENVAGVIVPVGVSGAPIENTARVLGTTAQLAATINREHLSRIIIIQGALGELEEDKCCRIASRMGITVSRTISALVPGATLEFTTMSGVHMVDSRPVSFTRTQELVKRAFDILASSLLILLVSPILVLTAILIKVTSPGPLLYKSFRVGRGGRYFRFYKFRSMTCGAPDNRALANRNEQKGHLFKIKNDPRITPVGRIIRRYSLDELPQVFNVLIGDMSLVGPRPLPTQDMEGDGMSKQYAAWAETRARALPGITGLWQVQGRSSTGFDRMMELDIEYIQKWSLKLDLIILLKTPAAVLSAAGAY
jgi:exopolysaccharide biosynthesis polyprenyl glycosylphosphotransferase